MTHIEILVVDDSNLLREGIKKILEKYNCILRGSSNGLEGLKSAIETPPDIIFLDLMMPTFEGIDMLKTLRVLKATKELPVVIITAHRGNKIIAQAEDIGITKILYKPLTRKMIVATLEEIFGNNFSRIEPSQGNIESIPNFIEKKPIKISIEEEEQIKKELFRIFVRSIDTRKKQVVEAIEIRNEVMLKAIIHELIGVGTTIGYSRLSLLSEQIESLISIGNMNDKLWAEIKEYVLKIIALFEIMQKR